MNLACTTHRQRITRQMKPSSKICMKYPDNFVPVPEVFWSFETGAPFKACSVCGTDLAAPGTNYFIEKAFKKEEAIFEYAMCWECREEIAKDLSQKSMELIVNYFQEHVDADKRNEQLKQRTQFSTDDWLGNCLIKDSPLNEAKEHQIYGHFVDENMVFDIFPYALSDLAVDDLIKLLSNETLGTLNDFSNKLFDIDLSNPVLII